MISGHEHRKNEHVSLAQKFYSETNDDFSRLRFIPQGIAHTAIDEVDISTQIGSIKLQAPFYIEAMTGGSQQTAQLNERLATIAKETHLAMAVGSQSVALKHPELESSFKIVRESNPNGILFANIGAEHSPEDAKKVVNMIQADALEIHINAVQELIMPEGNRTFAFIDNIDQIVKQIDVPVIVKEVGFGMSRQMITELQQVGVKLINVGGRGGTDFAQIENFRRPDKDMNYFNDWGLSTVESLLEALPQLPTKNIIATGGIKTPASVAKSMALGASAVGVAGFFLNQLFKYNTNEPIIETIQNWKYGLHAILALQNTRSWTELSKQKLLLSPELINYTKQRNIKY
ncbi:type 2 isopentenyl-diphosphate Delta-isomerase [Lentilactobacillus kribbianus]|uniref:type 2 isopentenyl-diphosphate Delta-isomerase n=1 Tax=Lentilactobacillus kribbianus TaxID=2729622 RepID=UPI001555B848|nr:type 2 isopentenyl-diphosphate Delta-isomerase [Lentilactobacillus kribbianus]